jgi:hypothetical protein
VNGVTVRKKFSARERFIAGTTALLPRHQIDVTNHAGGMRQNGNLKASAAACQYRAVGSSGSALARSLPKALRAIFLWRSIAAPDRCNEPCRRHAFGRDVCIAQFLPANLADEYRHRSTQLICVFGIGPTVRISRRTGAPCRQDIRTVEASAHGVLGTRTSLSAVKAIVRASIASALS